MNICFPRAKKWFFPFLMFWSCTSTYSFEIAINGVGGIFIQYSTSGTIYAVNIDPPEINANSIHNIFCAQEDEGNELIITAETDNGIKTLIYDMSSHQIVTFE